MARWDSSVFRELVTQTRHARYYSVGSVRTRVFITSYAPIAAIRRSSANFLATSCRTRMPSRPRMPHTRSPTHDCRRPYRTACVRGARTLSLPANCHAQREDVSLRERPPARRGGQESACERSGTMCGEQSFCHTKRPRDEQSSASTNKMRPFPRPSCDEAGHLPRASVWKRVPCSPPALSLDRDARSLGTLIAICL
jgi:hypothetical protein